MAFCCRFAAISRLSKLRSTVEVIASSGTLNLSATLLLRSNHSACSIWRGPARDTRCLYRNFTNRTNQLKIVLEEGVTVKELSKKLNVSPDKVFKILRNNGGKTKSLNSKVPHNLASLVAMEMGYTVKEPRVTEIKRRKLNMSDPNLVWRSPVVTIMGHVDHGKTTLLDSLRKTSVVSQEAGGITQHIGAFEVTLSGDRHVTFLDTPGHAAFTSMRARGTQVTDIVVLVVAADDGIQAQTIESIKLAQEANVPIVVAINKCDKRNANPDRVCSDLLHHEVQLERFGGDVQSVNISALEGSGLPSLVDAILVQAELMNLRGDPRGPVEGVVIEAHKDIGLGPIATVLIQHGTLRVGSYLVSGQTWAKVRVIRSDTKAPMTTATLSQPVVTAGWKDIPLVGEDVLEAATEKQAKEVISFREKQLTQSATNPSKLTNPPSSPSATEEELQVVPLILKGDVVGSLEVLEELITQNQPSEFQLKIIKSEVGNVTINDIDLALSTKGKIVGFNIKLPKEFQSVVGLRKVDVILNNVIYKLLEELKDNLEKLLPKKEEEETVGEAIVLQVFQLKGKEKAEVAGCRVKKGKLEKNYFYKILRNDETIYEGSLQDMKHGKDGITSARKETECGLSFKRSPETREGDVIVCYKKNLVRSELTWSLSQYTKYEQKQP